MSCQTLKHPESRTICRMRPALIYLASSMLLQATHMSWIGYPIYWMSLSTLRRPLNPRRSHPAAFHYSMPYSGIRPFLRLWFLNSAWLIDYAQFLSYCNPGPAWDLLRPVINQLISYRLWIHCNFIWSPNSGKQCRRPHFFAIFVYYFWALIFLVEIVVGSSFLWRFQTLQASRYWTIWSFSPSRQAIHH